MVISELNNEIKLCTKKAPPKSKKQLPKILPAKECPYFESYSGTELTSFFVGEILFSPIRRPQ
ncbi:MAG: hypothetical protein ACI9T9_001508 [Oleiphilaceae bacterium]|jgi:hypothetical protein